MFIDMNKYDEAFTHAILNLYAKAAWFEDSKDNYPSAEFKIAIVIKDPQNPTEKDFLHANQIAVSLREEFHAFIPSYTINIKYRFVNKKIPIKKILQGLLSMCD